MQALIGVKRLDFQQTGEVQSENDDNNARNFGQQSVVLVGELADAGRNRAQGNEDHAEPQNEGNGMQHHGSEQAPVRRLQVLDGGSRDQRHIARYERKHARREKRQQSRHEGGDWERKAMHKTLL